MSTGTQEYPNGGHWHGHFEKDGVQTPQLLVLHFEAGKLADDGKSCDEIGPYTISGAYNPPAKDGTVMKWTKTYTGAKATHSVAYEGTLKKNTGAANKEKDSAWYIEGAWNKPVPGAAAAAADAAAKKGPLDALCGKKPESGKFLLNSPVHQDPNGGLWYACIACHGCALLSAPLSFRSVPRRAVAWRSTDFSSSHARVRAAPYAGRAGSRTPMVSSTMWFRSCTSKAAKSPVTTKRPTPSVVRTP
jgi:hypothetical protein